MRTLLNTVYLFVALLSGLLASACAHSPATARSGEPFHAFACPKDEAKAARSFGEALELALDVDSLEVISHGGGHDQLTVAERGTKCSGATDLAACKAELTRQKLAWVQAQPACDDCNGAILVITTRKDEIALWAQPEQALTLLGAIDTPTDAWLLMMARTGYSTYACGDSTSSGYRALPQGFELLRREWVSTCRPIERVEIVERFDRDGRVEPVRRTVIEHEPDGCYVP
jgi:hypothetical protein